MFNRQGLCVLSQQAGQREVKSEKEYLTSWVNALNGDISAMFVYRELPYSEIRNSLASIQ